MPDPTYIDNSASTRSEINGIWDGTNKRYNLNDGTTANPLDADFARQYYVKTLLENSEPKLVYAKYGDEQPLPQGNGKRMQWRKFSKLAKALTPLTEGVTPVGNNLTMSTVDGAINQYGDWIRLSDIVKLTALDNLVVQATKQLGSQAGRTRDTIVREVLMGGTAVRYAPKYVSNVETAVATRSGLDMTALMTPNLLIQAATDLDAMDNEGVDGGEDYVAIMHPFVAYDLMRHPEWKDWQVHQNGERLYAREVGRIGKIHIVTTSEAKIWKSSTDSCPSYSESSTTKYMAVFGTIVLAAHAYGVTELQGAGLEHILKPLGYGEDPLNQRASVGWKCTLGATRLNEDAMVRIESCSSYSKQASAN
ncbi:MAG: N4-gp56 family major capsid protein [Clostridia bacterium]|nr:N4-gp56 family major capsid protein [Clostridia bacterium]